MSHLQNSTEQSASGFGAMEEVTEREDERGGVVRDTTRQEDILFEDDAVLIDLLPGIRDMVVDTLEKCAGARGRDDVISEEQDELEFPGLRSIIRRIILDIIQEGNLETREDRSEKITPGESVREGVGGVNQPIDALDFPGLRALLREMFLEVQ